jgi:hypothetical protein
VRTQELARRRSSTVSLLVRRLAEWTAPGWVSRVLLALLVLLYVGWIGYQYARDKLYHFNLYYIAAQGFLRGVDVYSLAQGYGGTNAAQWKALAEESGVVHYAPPYRYPPLTAQLVLPLTFLSPRVAGMVWITLTAAAFVAAAWLLGRSTQAAQGPALAYGLLLISVPALATMNAGQVNGLVLAAVCLGFYSIAMKRWTAAGLGMAVAALLKLFPVALVLYLPWRRLGRASIAAFLAIGILLLSAPLVLGSGTLRAYAESFLAMAEPGTVFTSGANQSLSGFWGRLLGDGVSSGSIYTVYLISAAIVVGCTVASLWPPGAVGSRWQAEVGLVLCALQLILPYTWYHQLALLLVPLFVVVGELLEGGAPDWWIVPIGLGLLATDVHGLLWHHIPVSFLSTPFYTTVMLWLMLIWLVARRRSGGLVRGADGLARPRGWRPGDSPGWDGSRLRADRQSRLLEACCRVSVLNGLVDRWT